MSWMRGTVGIPPHCSGVLHKGCSTITCILMHYFFFSWWKCVHPDGLKCWVHQLPTPHKQNRWNTESQIWKHLTNELLIIATFQTHSSAEKKNKEKTREEPVCHASNILFSLTCLRDTFWCHFFQLQSHVGCLMLKVSIYLILIIVNTHCSHYL